jgi:SAM-dependent methyltransferase
MSGIEPDTRRSNLVSEPYSSLADAYCASAELGFSEDMARFALDRASSIMPGRLHRIADIACGAGAACIVFARHGLSVTGTDKSPHMIRRAEANAMRADQHIRLLVQDYRNLALAEPVDLITCMYDSLNFMPSEADLAKVFSAVYTSLNSGGLFIFDMYTVRGLAETWGTKSEVHTVEADHFIATQTAMGFDGMTNTKTLYGFSRFSDGHWHRWEERHQIWAYPIDRIEALLIGSGFQPLDKIDWEHPQRGAASDQTCRVLFVARSPG